MVQDIKITPSSGTPQILFRGSGTSDTAIELNVVSQSDTALSFEGTEGQLLSITNNLSSGALFRVNDIAGLPIIEADASGDVKLAEYGRYVGVGTGVPSYLLDVFGTGNFQTIRFSDGTTQTTAGGGGGGVTASGNPSGVSFFGDDGNLTSQSNFQYSSGNRRLVFTGSGVSDNPINLDILSQSDTALSFEGTEGQLLSITNNLSSGALFRVNDIAGLPIIEADASGDVKLAEYGRYVGVGTGVPSYLLDVFGTGNFQAIRFSDGTTQTTAGLPGGSDTQVQFNNAGSFSGDPNFVWNSGTNTLTIKADPAQTENLQNWKDDSGSVLSSISSDGTVDIRDNLFVRNANGDRGVELNVRTGSTTQEIISIGTNLHLISAFDLMRVPSSIWDAWNISWDGGHQAGNAITIGSPDRDNSDAAPNYLKFLSGSAWSSATNNTDGGNIYIRGGEGTTSSNGGVIYLGTDGTTPAGTVESQVPFLAIAGAATDVPLTVKGASAQTANLQEWQDSSSNVMARVESDGAIQATYLRTPTYPTGAKRGFRLETCERVAPFRNVAGIAGIYGDDSTYPQGGHSYQGILRFSAGHNSTSTVDADVPAFYVDPYARVCIGDVLSVGESTSTARLSVSALQDLAEPEWTGLQKQLECAGGTLTANNSPSLMITAGTTIAEYPANSFIAPTMAAANTSVTATDASTVYISGPPTAGTNMTLTNSYALLVGGATDITASASDVVPLTLHAATSQTANLQEWQDSSGNVLGSISNDGSISTSGTITTNRSIKTPIESNSDGATITFDLDEANTHTVTLGGNRVLALSNASVGQKFTIRLTQDATGSRTVTWFSTIKWPGGLVPTLTTTADKTDVFGFICTSGSNYDGFVIGYNL